MSETDTIQKVIEENSDVVKDYRDSEDNALNFLVGQVMEKTSGKMNPAEARDKLLERLTDTNH